MTIQEIRKLLPRYHPSLKTVNLLRAHPVVLLVGISGAGKDTVKQQLLKTNDYYDFVSHTTRQPRENHGIAEVNGKDYHFITLDQAAEMLKIGEYIEANEYSANIYGTSVSELKRAVASNKVAINDIEVQGVDQYKQLAENTTAIFILPPNYDEWQKRITKRYTDGNSSSDNITLRRETAKKELQYALQKGYYHFVVNDSVDTTVMEIQAIVGGKDSRNEEYALSVANELLRDIETHDVKS